MKSLFQNTAKTRQFPFWRDEFFEVKLQLQNHRLTRVFRHKNVKVNFIPWTSSWTLIHVHSWPSWLELESADSAYRQ